MEKQTRSKAIRAYCMGCCGGNRAEVRRCHIRDCPLWWYRMGSPSKAENAEKAHVSDGNGEPM